MNTNIKKLLLTTFMALSAVWFSSAQTNYEKTVKTQGEDVSVDDLAINKRPRGSLFKKTRIIAKNGVEFAITFPDSYENLSIVRSDTNILVVGRKIKVIEPGHLSFEFTYTENGVSYTCDILGHVNYYGELEYEGQPLTSQSIIISNANDLSKRISADPKMAGVWWRVKVGSSYVDICEGTQARTLQELLDFAKAKGVNGKAEFEVEFSDNTSNLAYDKKSDSYVSGAYSVQYFSIEDARTYKVKLLQEGQGTVSVAKNEFKAGENVVLTAQAAQGWQFSHWEENGQHIGTANPLTFTMEAQHRTIKAVFAQIPKYTVTLQIVDTKGTILARSQQQRVESGGSTTFQVPNLPNTNFKGWYHNGQLVGTSNTYSLSNITQDETIQAVFEIPVQTVALSFTELSLKVGERGELPTATVTPNNASDKTISWASDNEAVAKIEDGSVVGVSSGTTQLIASSVNGKTAALQVVVSEVQKYTITLQIVDTKGGILARSQQQRVESGGSTTFQVPNLPNTNFKGWYHNGQLVGTGNTYSLSNITQDETIQAVFEIPVQTVALSFTELSLKVGERGELPTATVTPNNASDKSIRWASDNEAIAKIEDGSVVGVSSGTTQLIASSANGKTAALQVVVSEVQKYTITLQIVDTKGGILARSQQQKVVSGSSTTFQVPNLPNTNFKGWYHNGQLVGTGNTYSLSNITQDETIQAVFEIPVQTVALSFSELSLKVGERGELPTATVTPNNASDKSIRWASDNEAIAKIEDGSVVGVSSGTTQLIASSVNGKTAALQVVVSEVQVIPVQSVTVTPASITAKVGDAPIQLTATVLPANATSPTVSWKSNNEQVVKVDSNGKVTIIAAGETTIEAKAGEKSFTVQVKVAAQAPLTPPAEEFPPYIKDFPAEITQGMAINIGQWEFLGSIDASQIRYHFTDADGKVLAVAPATLQANSLTFTQSGTFVLVATLPTNTAGWTEVRFSITVKIKN